ncbi:hypothetical protein [Ramlibacter sp.]|uniref:hypothetical protein n=1 Tax=Ramlibacter sp. TaxID=1917967 RepID=UPI002D7E60FC|nr:hypothetical protein [Ramlibacter sp.]
MRSAAAGLLVLALACAGCGERGGDTAVLGGNGGDEAARSASDRRALEVPPPPAPAGTPAQVVRTGEDTALAVWVQDSHVVSAAYGRAGGWSDARALEEIYGTASDAQLAGNGRGAAMAVWRHTVGNIQSLRFSRFDTASGWTAPDVLPGALPRPHAEGATDDQDAPQLTMQQDGSVTARWPSGFAEGEEQLARYTPGQGWSPPVAAPLASAQGSASAPAAGAVR